MIEEPIHDRDFVKCLCSIASTESASQIIYDGIRFGPPAIISSKELGLNDISVPRCSNSVDFNRVYQHIRSHFFSEIEEDDDVLPSLNMFFSNNGHEHLNAISKLNREASFVRVKMDSDETYDSIIFKRHENTLDMVVTLRTCEMIRNFPVVSTYFNLFFKVVCILTVTVPRKLTFVISAPCIYEGEENLAVSVYCKFNGGPFFATCGKELTVSIAKEVVTRNEAILAGNDIEKWSLSSLANVNNLIQPNYFQFI